VGGEGAVFGFDADGDAASDGEIGVDLAPSWVEDFHEVVENAVGYVFVEDAFVAEGPEVEFEGFGFDDFLVGDVADGNVGEVGLASHGANAGKFIGGKFDEIIAIGVAVGEGFQGAGRLGSALPEVGKLRVFVCFGSVVF